MSMPYGTWFLFPMATLVVGMAALAFTVWALVDAARRTDEDFAAVNHQRSVWLLLLGIGAVMQFGVAVALVYYFVVHRRFAAAPAKP